jgi:hypothetical protein
MDMCAIQVFNQIKGCKFQEKKLSCSNHTQSSHKLTRQDFILLSLSLSSGVWAEVFQLRQPGGSPAESPSLGTHGWWPSAKTNAGRHVNTQAFFYDHVTTKPLK